MIRAKIRALFVAVALGAVPLAATACSGGATISSAEVAGATIIDVRTVQEFNSGHLEGAVNYNVEDGTLLRALSGLDPNGSYIVYCRTGRRSAVAVEQMTAAGFSNIVDLGSVQDAAKATSLAIIN